VRLVSVQVEKFRNVIDSDVFTIEPDVTCLVGKNESGKTALLQAVYRLSPSHRGDLFEPLSHYPRSLLIKDRRQGVIEDTAPVTAAFELEAADHNAFEERFGPGSVTASRVVAQRLYDNQLFADLDDGALNEANAVRYVVEQASVSPLTAPRLTGAGSFDAVRSVVADLEQAVKHPPEGETAPPELVDDLRKLRDALVGALGTETGFLADAVASVLKERLPTIFYFGEYDFLEGRVDLDRLFGVPDTQLSGGERTAKALLELSGDDVESLLNEEYEERKAQLELVSNMLTGEIAEYWTQTGDLAVTIDIDRRTDDAVDGQTKVTNWLELRVQDRRNGHTTNFDERSGGFRWFFSFLASFARYDNNKAERVVILLDEPALTLHATAQRDFLRFIEDRLAPKHQVVFTTHSPFMIEPGHLERVRFVEDRGGDDGSKVTRDPTHLSSDSLFPLQGAIGFGIAKDLLDSPNLILVETISDYTYLRVLSDHLRAVGRNGLDDQWKVVPVGSAARVGIFVALMGQGVNATVVFEANDENAQLSALVAQGAIESGNLVTPAQVTSTAEASLEDLFDLGDYLAIFNVAFRDTGAALTPAELGPGDRVVQRIEDLRGAYDRDRPAEVLLRHRDQIMGALSEVTLFNFEQLFRRVNAGLT